MDSYSSVTPRDTTHKTYREQWTVGGLLGSFACLAMLLALFVAPLLVAATALGAVSAHLYGRLTRPATTTQQPAATVTRRA